MSSKKATGKILPLKKRQPTPIKNSPDDEIPAFMKPFEGKSMKEVATMMVPQMANEQAQQCFAGLFSSLYDTGVPVPEWVKRASQRALEGLQVDYVQKMLADPATADLSAIPVGTLTGLMEIMRTTIPAPPGSQLEKTYKEVVAPLEEHLKTLAIKEGREKVVPFFKAYDESEKVAAKLQLRSQRTNICLVLAVRWQEVEKLESSDKLFAWLLDLKGADGRPLIGRQKGSREIRKVCKIIGLEFQNKYRSKKP